MDYWPPWSLRPQGQGPYFLGRLASFRFPWWQEKNYPKKVSPVVKLAPKPSSQYFQVQEGHGPALVNGNATPFQTHQGMWMCGSGGNKNNICEKFQNGADLFCCFVRFDVSCKIRLMFTGSFFVHEEKTTKETTRDRMFQTFLPRLQFSLFVSKYLPFQGVDEENYQPKRRANLCMKMEPMIHWKPNSCFASGDWDSIEHSKKKLVSNVSSFTLSHGKCWNNLFQQTWHIQVGWGIMTIYPIYIVYRCGSEIISPNTFHKNLISKVFCNSTSPCSSLFQL